MYKLYGLGRYLFLITAWMHDNSAFCNTCTLISLRRTLSPSALSARACCIYQWPMSLRTEPLTKASIVLKGLHFLWNRGVINIWKYPGNIFATPPIGQKKFLWPPYPAAYIFVTPLKKKEQASMSDFSMYFQQSWHGTPGLAEPLVHLNKDRMI